MRPIFKLPIMLAILALAWAPIVQARQLDTSKVEAVTPADLELLRTMSKEGDPQAQYQLGEAYRVGLWVEQDLEKALELYKRSAEQGYAASQYRLGELNEKGEILERDLGKAV